MHVFLRDDLADSTKIWNGYIVSYYEVLSTGKMVHRVRHCRISYRCMQNSVFSVSSVLYIPGRTTSLDMHEGLCVWLSLL